jgi:hypothetical protein
MSTSFRAWRTAQEVWGGPDTHGLSGYTRLEISARRHEGIQMMQAQQDQAGRQYSGLRQGSVRCMNMT